MDSLVVYCSLRNIEQWLYRCVLNSQSGSPLFSRLPIVGLLNDSAFNHKLALFEADPPFGFITTPP
jgi:hypothetical protein